MWLARRRFCGAGSPAAQAKGEGGEERGQRKAGKAGCTIRLPVGCTIARLCRVLLRSFRNGEMSDGRARVNAARRTSRPWRPKVHSLDVQALPRTPEALIGAITALVAHGDSLIAKYNRMSDDQDGEDLWGLWRKAFTGDLRLIVASAKLAKELPEEDDAEHVAALAAAAIDAALE